MTRKNTNKKNKDKVQNIDSSYSRSTRAAIGAVAGAGMSLLAGYTAPFVLAAGATGSLVGAVTKRNVQIRDQQETQNQQQAGQSNARQGNSAQQQTIAEPANDADNDDAPAGAQFGASRLLLQSNAALAAEPDGLKQADAARNRYNRWVKKQGWDLKNVSKLNKEQLFKYWQDNSENVDNANYYSLIKSLIDSPAQFVAASIPLTAADVDHDVWAIRNTNGLNDQQTKALQGSVRAMEQELSSMINTAQNGNTTGNVRSRVQVDSSLLKHLKTIARARFSGLQPNTNSTTNMPYFVDKGGKNFDLTIHRWKNKVDKSIANGLNMGNSHYY
jgi:hypothetical protein